MSYNFNIKLNKVNGVYTSGAWVVDVGFDVRVCAGVSIGIWMCVYKVRMYGCK